MRFISSILVSIFLFTVVCFPRELVFCDAAPVPSATLGETVEQDRLEVWTGDYAQPRTGSALGVFGWLTDLYGENRIQTIYGKLASTYITQFPEGEAFEIGVTYFDGEAGLFGLTYRGSDQTWKSMNDVVELTGSGEWKYHRFQIYDAGFSGGMSDADFYLSVYDTYYDLHFTPGDVLFGRITAARMPLVIQADSGCIGNIFYETGEHPFSVSLTNTTSVSEEIHLTYQAVCEQTNTVVWQDNALIQAGVEQTASVIARVPVERYGTFLLKVSATGAEGEYLAERSFAFAAVPQGTSAGNDRFGVCTHASSRASGGRYADTLNSLVANGGAAWIRDDLPWQLYEAQKGVYAVPQVIQNAVDAATESGRNVMLILGGTNPLYDAGQLPVSDEALAAFEEYAYHAAKELTGKVDYFETFNEYNLQANGSAARYVKLLKATYNGVKRGNPNAKVVGMNVAGTDPSFLTAVGLLGGFSYLDIISVHPYSAAGDPDPDAADLTGRMQQVQNVVNLFAPGKEVWISEIGWSTTKNQVDNGTIENFTGEQAAAWLVKSYAHSIGQGLAAKLFFYDFQNDGIYGGVKEENFGMIRSGLDGEENQYAARPAYLAAAFLNRLLSGAQPDTNTQADSIYRYRFVRPSDGVYLEVIWSGLDSGEVNLNLPNTGQTMIYDLYGNLLYHTDNSPGSTYKLNLGDKPVYVVYTPQSFGAGMRYTVDSAQRVVTVSGRIPDGISGRGVALHVMRSAASFEDIPENPMAVMVYADQGKTDRYGDYEFSFALPEQEGLYTAYVAFDGIEGVYQLNIAAGSELLAALGVSQQGRQISQLADLDEARSFDVTAEVFNYAAQPMTLIYAFYHKGQLVSAETCGIQSENANFTKTIRMNSLLQQKNDFDSFRVFLWDGAQKLTCYTKSITINEKRGF